MKSFFFINVVHFIHCNYLINCKLKLNYIFFLIFLILIKNIKISNNNKKLKDILLNIQDVISSTFTKNKDYIYSITTSKFL